MNNIPSLSTVRTNAIWLAEKAADSFGRTVQTIRSSVAATFRKLGEQMGLRNQNTTVEASPLTARLIPLEDDNNVPIVSAYSEGEEPVYPESNSTNFINESDIEPSRSDYRGDGALVNAREGNWDAIMRNFGNKASFSHYFYTGEILPMSESTRKNILTALAADETLTSARRQEIKNALGGNGIFAAVFR